MLPLIGTVFVASLFGSLHCVGMCGPLAMLASSHRSHVHKNHRQVNVQAVMAYHGSRMLAYAIAGAIVGLVGAGIQHTGDWFGWQRLAAQLAGGSMLVIGLLAIVRLAGGTSHTLWMPAGLQRQLARGHAWARQQPPVARAATIGLLTAILPCGWLFAFLIVAAGTASAVSGALVMATFALGSVPALAGLAMSMTLLVGRFRTLVPWCSAILITIVGGATLVTRAGVELETMVEPSSQAGATLVAGNQATKLTSAVQAVQAIDHERLPCCCQKNDQALCADVAPIEVPGNVPNTQSPNNQSPNNQSTANQSNTNQSMTSQP